ncbi:MAG TPA: ATP-binding protein [Candidatus Kapabacteria bacterium]|nr:ATP-binding protein [Candidatus Kapabacteria bacterium]
MIMDLNFTNDSLVQIIERQGAAIFIVNYEDNKIVYSNSLANSKFHSSLNKKIIDILNLQSENDLYNVLVMPNKLFDYKNRPKSSIKGQYFDSKKNEYFNFDVYAIINNEKKYKVLILNEITELKTNLNTLEAQNRMFHTIFNEAPVAIWYMDNTGDYRLTNSFITNNMTSNGVWSVKEEEYQRIRESTLEVLKKVNYSIKYEPHTFVDGRVHQMKIIRKRIFDENGNKQGVIGIGTDITEIKNTEEKIKYLKELNELISEHSSRLIHCTVDKIDDYVRDALRAINSFVAADRVYICDIDSQKRELKINFEHYSSGIIKKSDWVELTYEKVSRWIDILSYNSYLLIPDVGQLPYKYAVEKQLLERRGVKSMLAFPLYYNSELAGFISFSNLTNYKYWDNETIFLLRIAIEIISGTLARKDFELRIINAMNTAEEANRTKSEFLANMSHEIGTPMNAILGFSEILRESITGTIQKSYLNTIISSGRNLMKLINDILDLSKIEAGRIDIVPTPVDLVRIFDEIEKIFEIKIKDKNLNFIIDIDPNVSGYWLFDETRLRQVLFNVVGNAIKFTDKGFIKISAKLITCHSSNEQNIEISIEDTGIGIPEEHQKRIFDSFYQVSNKSGKKYDGTGLGLAITMRLIKAMNGEVKLESYSNIGTTITISFKDVRYAEVSIIRNIEVTEINKEHSFENAQILVVDDIQDNREVIKIFIEEHQGIIIEASNGRDALKLASFYKPAVIILDVRMPDMSGFEVLHHIRNDERICDIPIIALTAVSSAFQEKHLYKDFDAVLTKPVRKDELINKLSKLIEKKLSI